MSTTVRYHIGENGPGKCSVNPSNPKSRGCPFGGESGDDDHFGSMKEAQDAYERKMEGEGSSFLNSERREKNQDELDLDRRTFVISTDVAEKAEKKIAALNRRLKKTGTDERFTYTREDSEKLIQITTENAVAFESYDVKPGEQLLIRQSTFVLNRPRISAGDWEFQSAFERIAGSDNFVARTAHGVELNGWTPDSGVCDHCGQKRKRNKLYLIKNNEDGSTMTIGSSCVQPFLGVNPNLWYLNVDGSKITDSDEDFRGEPRGEPVMDNRTLIARGLAVSEGGKDFVSKRMAGDYGREPTISSMDIFYDSNPQTEPIRHELEAKAKQYLDDGTVDEVLKSSESINRDSDYGSNVHKLLDHGYASRRNQSTLVSIIGNYGRQKRKEVDALEAEKNRLPEPSGFIGKEKERIRNIPVRITNVYNGQRMGFGYYAEEENYCLVTARTENNEEIVWTKAGYSEFEVGEEIDFTGTVKSHKQYKGKDQTNFGRVILKALKNEETEN